MKLLITIISMISTAFISCSNSFTEEPVRAEYITEINSKIKAGYQNVNSWINSPKDIALHLFPSVSHDSGPKKYKIEQHSLSNSNCIIKVIEQGLIDDEIKGELKIIDLQLSNGQWLIKHMKYKVKRQE